MKILKEMKLTDHEQLVFVQDKTTGLKGIICIHNTVLGPALGGTRIWNYDCENDAIVDVMRLARGMTYKNAAAGLNIGGGKAVLIGDASKIKSEAFFRAYGRFVEGLNGRYITAADVNTNTNDMEYIHMETNHVVGLRNKSGDPSPLTAFGAFHGIRASLQHVFNDSDLSKYSYAVQGIGKTGRFLISYLVEAGASKIYYTDIDEAKINIIKNEYPNLVLVKPDEIMELNVDVFVPCALGGGLNDKTIPKLNCKIVAGTANNILKDEVKHSKMLKERGILYAPDFIINAGGVINVYHEIQGYDVNAAKNDVKKIYDRLLQIYDISKNRNIDTHKAANVFAEERIELIKNIHTNYIP